MIARMSEMITVPKSVTISFFHLGNRFEVLSQ